MKNDEELRLYIKGEISGNEAYFVLKEAQKTPEDSDYYNETQETYTLTLDSITKPDSHFSQVMDNAIKNGPLMLGENIEAYAEVSKDEITMSASTNAWMSNIARSATSKANSLFADTSIIENGGVNNEAHIINFRHLENLDGAVSGLTLVSAVPNSVIDLSKAVQKGDID